MKTLLGVLSFLLTFAVTRGIDAREIAHRSLPATVLIEALDAHGQPLALGSGFFVSATQLVTNYHVVTGASSLRLKVTDSKEQITIETVSRLDERNDLVIIECPTDHPVFLPLATTEPVIGESVYVIGNPKGLEGTFSNGLVSSIRKDGELSLIQISAPISPGSSGGAVLNSAGEVLGVAVASLIDGQNLNFAIPVQCVTSLLGKPPLELRLSQIPSKESGRFGERLLNGVQIVGQVITIDAFQKRNMEQYNWDPSRQRIPCTYEFRIKNTLNKTVTDVRYIIINLQKDGEPLDFCNGEVIGAIPPGLAKHMSEKWYQYPNQTFAIRVIDFKTQ